MKFQILGIAMLLSTAAFAKDLDVLCTPNLGGQFANSFSGSGRITITDETPGNQLATGRLSLTLEAGDNKKTLMHDFEGTIETIKSGFMVGESLYVDLLSQDKSILLKMFLNGPKNQQTARVLYKGIEFRSSCDSAL